MKLAEMELKVAIYSRLTIGAYKIPYNFYEEIPTGENYPFICFGSIISTDDSQKSLPGQQINVTFDAWDSIGPVGGSDERLLDMLDKALQSITVSNSKNPVPLVLMDFDINYVGFEGVDLIPNIDQSIRHGQLKLKFMVTEK